MLEDAPEIVLLVEALLSTLPGLAVRTCADGRTGLVAARQQLPDLVLLDLQLPHLSGAQVLAALRADPATRHLRVVLFTGDRPRSTAELVALGADGQLAKPFTPAALLGCVTDQLGQVAAAQLAARRDVDIA